MNKLIRAFWALLFLFAVFLIGSGLIGCAGQQKQRGDFGVEISEPRYIVVVNTGAQQVVVGTFNEMAGCLVTAKRFEDWSKINEFEWKVECRIKE